MKDRLKGMVRWLSPLLLVLFLVLYTLNLPFYAGGPIGQRMRWRMEHGRLKVERLGHARQERFWIDINSEGLRFAPEMGIDSVGEWMVNVPLWMPVLAAGGFTVWAWYGRRRRAGGCAGCGYELGPLDRCPECGAQRGVDSPSR